MKGITLTLAITIVSAVALPRLLESAEGEIVPTFDAIADTAFLLFTRRNPTNSQLLHISDMNVIRNSFFDSGRPTRFLIHGMFGNRNSALNTITQPALLQAGDFNVIVVDWGAGALTNVMVNARFVGAALAYFLDNLQNAGLMNFNQLTLIGHSMGAHISGFAGKKIRGRINTIIGLDAADVGDINDPSTRIDAGDAEYVELIQTEIVFWGIPAPIGHANFYPAGGTNQPNCGGSQVCDHMIAIDYFAESLSTPNRFYAQRCLNMDQMRANACPSSSTDYLMGGSTSNQNRNLRGIFRLPVNAQRPFAVGRDTLDNEETRTRKPSELVRSELRKREYEDWQRLKSKGKGVVLFQESPKLNRLIYEKHGLTTSEWITYLKMVGNVAAVRVIPGRSSGTNRCRIDSCNEIETLSHVLGSCPQGELLRHNRNNRVVNQLANELRKNWTVLVEFTCISTDGSIRRVDLVIYNEDSRNGYILDPTVRFENDENQPESVNEEKKRLYEPCIADIQSKLKLKQLSVIGLMVGARGTIPKIFAEFCQKFKINKSVIQEIVSEGVRGSYRILHNHTYDPGRT